MIALLIAYAAGGFTVAAWGAATVVGLLAFHEVVDRPYPTPPTHRPDQEARP